MINILKTFQRDINCLADENRTTRRRALSKLTKQLIDGNEVNSEQGKRVHSPEQMKLVLNGVLKPMLKLFSDPVEKCRELAVEFITRVIPMIDEIESSLPYIIPVITSRLAPEAAVEHSEEIRLSLLNLLVVIVQSVDEDLSLYVNDVIAICCKGLVDQFPEVKRTTCKLIIDFAPKVKKRFYGESKLLVQPLQVCVSHQHSRVRAFAVKAIGCTVQYGEVTIIDDILTTLGQLLFDNGVVVRKALCEVVGEWLYCLVDRYSYHHKLLPLLISFFSDEVLEVSELAKMYMQKIGDQYERENEEDLKDQIDYAVAFREVIEGRKRPSLGCRVLCSRSLSKIVPAVMSELADWTAFRRKKASYLLYDVMFFVEDYVTQHLELILNGMYKAVLDDEEEVRGNVCKCAKLLGIYVNPDAYLNIVTPHFSIYSGTPNFQAACLKIMSFVIEGFSREQLGKADNLERICTILSDKEFLSSEHTQLLWSLNMATFAVIRASQSDCKPHSFHLCLVLLHCQSFASMGSDLRMEAVEAASLLFRHCFSSDEEWEDADPKYGLYGVHFGRLLKTLKQDMPAWTKHCSERLLFENLMECSGPYVGKNLEDVVVILKEMFKVERDPDMRLSFFTLLCRLLSSEGNPLNSTGELDKFSENIIVDMVMPNLTWRSGRTASAIRTAAMSTLWAVLKSRSLNLKAIHSGKLVEDLFPQLKSTLEDDNPSTRLVVCSVLQEIFRVFERSINPDLLHGFYDDLIKRMDDNRDEIRVAITKTFSLYIDCLPCPYDKVLYSAHTTAMSRGLLIHLDDPETQIQDGVLEVLKKLACLDADCVLRNVEAVRHKHRTPLYCEELVRHCRSLLGVH